MNFYKKNLILKQTNRGFSLKDGEVSGIVRLEHEDGDCTLSLSLLNFRGITDGEYFCAVLFQNCPIEFFSLGNKPSCHVKNFSINTPFSYFSVGIFAVYKKSLAYENCLVAFASEEGGVEEGGLTDAFSFALEKDCSFNQTKIYDDEAVATENYYTIEEKIEDKVRIIEEWNKDVNGNENSNEHIKCEEKEEERQFECDCPKDEKSVKKGVGYSREHPYYLSAKRELEELFSKFPKENSLSKTLPGGRFCKIYYSENKYYTVGSLEEDGEVKYICYGVPGSYAPTPPKELKDYCSFVPLSIFDLQGEGFWMMFQDAITGERLKKEN